MDKEDYKNLKMVVYFSGKKLLFEGFCESCVEPLYEDQLKEDIKNIKNILKDYETKKLINIPNVSEKEDVLYFKDTSYRKHLEDLIYTIKDYLDELKTNKK